MSCPVNGVNAGQVFSATEKIAEKMLTPIQLLIILIFGPAYCVSTIGLDEHQIREYIKNQWKIEQGKLAQLNLPDFQ